MTTASAAADQSETVDFQVSASRQVRAAPIGGRRVPGGETAITGPKALRYPTINSSNRRLRRIASLAKIPWRENVARIARESSSKLRRYNKCGRRSALNV